MKLFLQKELLLSCLEEGKILPIHLQLNPTNKCNFNCSFCSCSARDKMQELPLPEIMKFMDMFLTLGGKSVTITGGGEPSMHQDFSQMIMGIARRGIDIGLVTNGTLMNRIDEVLDYVTWVRISSSDNLPLQLKYIKRDVTTWLQRIAESVLDHPTVDWAFSHVVTQKDSLACMKTDSHLVAKIIRFANTHDFTHVRLVNDIFMADELEATMHGLKAHLVNYLGLDCSKVNFQDRSTWTKGTTPCYISILKPVLGADGYLYPCCGTQYALGNPSRDYEKTMQLGYMTDFEKLVEEQRFFNGRVCAKCYYSGYNQMLGVMVHSLNHVNFV